MEKIQNAIVWAEIPVLNFERAKAFYSKIFDYDMYEEMMGTYRMGFLPMDPDSKGAGAAIVQGENYIPSALGTKVFLYGGNDLTQILNRVDRAGGKVILPKTIITDEIGYYATFEDTEGNHVCLHSQK